MTPLISARRAAEDFARVVDGSQADVANRYGDLTACVELLRAQETPEARPEFVADLRTQLMAAADTQLVPAQRTTQDPARPTLAPVITLPQTTRRRERRLAVAAAAFVVVGGTAGVAAAAESALPGQALYPVKRAIESAQVSLNSSDAAKGQELIDQAGTRLDEIDALMSDGDATEQITRTLAAYERSASSGADLLFVSYQRDADTDQLAALRSSLSEQHAQLQQLAGQAPPTTQPDFASASALVGDLDQQARVLCGNCGPDTGAPGFDLSSSPALGSLLTEPAAAVAADQFRSQAQSLAEKAAQIAKNTPQSTTQTSGSTTTQGGVSVPSTGSTVPSPSGSTVTGTVTGTTTGTTTGVESLLTDVSTSTGGVLSPVTDAVNGTIDSVTGLVTGP